MWLAAVLLVQNGRPQTTTLYLRNGDRLTGTIVSEDPRQITIDSPLLGKISVPLEGIERRESKPAPPPPPVAASPAPPISAEEAQRLLNELSGLYLTSKITAGEYHQRRAEILRKAEPGPVPPAAVAAAAAAPPKAKAPKHWSVDAQAGLDLGFSEKKRELYSVRLKVLYARGHFRNAFDYSFTYGRNDEVLSANRMDAFSKTDYDVSKRVYVYNLVGVGYDQIRRIDLRYEIGPGIGYHILRGTNYVLNGETGLNYQAQNLADDTETRLIFFRFAEELTWKLNSWLSYDERFEFFPEATRWGSYRFRFETNLRYWLKNNLSLSLTLLDQYDTDPAQGVARNDLQVRSSVGLKF